MTFSHNKELISKYLVSHVEVKRYHLHFYKALFLHDVPLSRVKVAPDIWTNLERFGSTHMHFLRIQYCLLAIFGTSYPKWRLRYCLIAIFGTSLSQVRIPFIFIFLITKQIISSLVLRGVFYLVRCDPLCLL